ncbi:putative isomerase YbhE [Stemphylium lycopersici]|uniref:Isomerase YbhE n=1 Tax=Stemphylium lycopersici TaxID=183478 RepID=A0A364N6R4_STELY|nr:extracellular aldonolactonase protein [Stemphylium lycopersici]RAR00527.1 putative isomerase YbhE [Stemphylium lycopersici]RAR12721.1 isomerase YbhE [Stemphylium lycopersici]
MRSLILHSVLPTLFMLIPSSTSQLFAAHSDGNLSTLFLTEDGNKSSLNVTSVTADCGPNPATLNVDYQNKILYCLDRGRSRGTQGSLNSFRIAADGSLKRLARVSAPFSGVTAELFDDEETGVRGYVSGSYNRSAIGVYRLPDAKGSLAEPAQTIFPNTIAAGPVTARQDRSYLHGVFLDPTRKFLLMTDLGQDRIRVFRYNKQTIAPLVELAPLITPRGCGPRKAVFWTAPETGNLFMFVNGELDQRIYSYQVEYKKNGLKWKLVGNVVSVSEDLPATTAPTSEIAVTPDGRFVIVSNRDVSFSASPIHRSKSSDTLSVFSINPNGTLKPVQHAPSGGYSPRQFMINTEGDKIAVGHQNNNTVVIWKRDIETGKIVREEDGGKLGVATLSGAVVFTQWYP